jgi:hypothetical protein
MLVHKTWLVWPTYWFLAVKQYARLQSSGVFCYLCRRCVFETSSSRVKSPNVIMRLLGHDWLRWSHFTSRCTTTPSSPLIWFPLAQLCVLPHAKWKIYVLVSEMILQPDQFVFHHYRCVHHCSVAVNPKRYPPLNPLRSNLKIGRLNTRNQISSKISSPTIMFTWWSS